MANPEVLFNKIVSTTCEGKIGNEKNTYQRSTSLNLLLVTCQNVTFGNFFFHWEWVWCCVFLRSCAKINCIRGNHVVKISKCIQTISKCSSCEMLPVGICTQLLQGLQVLCRFFCVSPTGECHNWQHGFYRWRGSRSRATEKRPDTTKVSKTRKAKHSKSKASKTNINKHNYRTPFFWISGFAFAGILTSQESRLRSPYLSGFEPATCCM